jgi:two-component system chemotaxis response regulator CheB
VRARGGEVYAQDEESCIVYGMPRSVIEAGLASAVLPLDKMAAAIERWACAERPLASSVV